MYIENVLTREKCKRSTSARRNVRKTALLLQTTVCNCLKIKSEINIVSAMVC